MTLRSLLEAAREQESPEALQQFLRATAGDAWPLLQEVLQRLQATPSPPTKPGQTCDFSLASAEDAALAAELAKLPAHHFPEDTVLEGKFKLRERLGTGGMGEVYAADQLHPVRRRVAVKVIKAGMDTRQVLRRFEQERQALALMDHPHIAKILDGGMTPEGHPFFVMELVKGLSITRYCDQEKLTPKERLQLFVPVCEAVQHAHQKGIIHRDLKPSNILVSLVDNKPMPKIIDFGVAKALHGPLGDQSVYTELHMVVGTLEYMSPEQAQANNLDIDTRSDIYSLGVVLYELLSGVLPFTRQEQLRGAMDAIVKVIREVEPAKPSTKVSTLKDLPEIASRRKLDPQRLTKMLSGDLDWIVLKCLEKERDRRYGTALGLATDVERYLRDEAVLAAPPSTAYRMRKFFRRHRGKVLLTGLALALLLASTAVATVGMLHARAAQQLADQAKNRAEEEVAIQAALLAFIEKDIFAAADAADRLKMGLPLDKVVEVRTLLERAANQLDRGRFPQVTKIEAAIRLTLGKAFHTLGSFDSALQQFQRAEQLLTAHAGSNDPQRLEALEHLCKVLTDLRRFDQAEPLNRQLIATRSAVLGPFHQKTLTARYMLCSLQHAQGRLEHLQQTLQQLIADQQAHLGPRELDTLNSRRLLAALYFQGNQLDRTDAELRTLLPSYEETLGAIHPDTLAALNLAALLAGRRGDQAASEKHFRQMIDAGTKLLGPLHPNVLLYKYNLASCLMRQGRIPEAKPLLREASEVFEKIDPAHRYTLAIKRRLAAILVAQEDFTHAIILYEGILAHLANPQAESDPVTWDILKELLEACYQNGEVDKGMVTGERLLIVLKRHATQPGVTKRMVDAIEYLCQGYVHNKQNAEAAKLVRQQLKEQAFPEAERHLLETLLQQLTKAM